MSEFGWIKTTINVKDYGLHTQLAILHTGAVRQVVPVCNRYPVLTLSVRGPSPRRPKLGTLSTWAVATTA